MTDIAFVEGMNICDICLLFVYSVSDWHTRGLKLFLSDDFLNNHYLKILQELCRMCVYIFPFNYCIC